MIDLLFSVKRALDAGIMTRDLRGTAETHKVSDKVAKDLGRIYQIA